MLKTVNIEQLFNQPAQEASVTFRENVKRVFITFSENKQLQDGALRTKPNISPNPNPNPNSVVVVFWYLVLPIRCKVAS